MEVSITGAKIYYVIPGINYPITQTVVNAWIAMVVIVGLCIWLTRGMQVHARTKRQVVAEMIVQMAQNLVRGNMGAKWDSFVPFIAAILSMSVVSSLMGLTGAYSPTNDLNTFLAWGILVFVLITYHKIKANGFGGYLKGFTEPIFVMTPMNIISEIATPISMSLRHFANLCSGYVIGPVREAFADGGTVAAWANDAVLWAYQNGILSGERSGEDKEVRPADNATRAQASVMMMRYVEWLESEA